MRINKILLENFRNHKKYVLEPSSSVTLIHGSNGSGKTNLLEAISLLGLGKSSRASLERELINIDSSYARVVGEFDTKDKLEIAIQRKENSNRVLKVCKVNGVKKPGVQFVGMAKSVLFAPEDIRLVAGSPSRRRDYIDRILGQVDRQYYKSLLKYNKVLRQRNKLLERFQGQILRNVQETQLSFWNSQLLEAGKAIQDCRSKFFEYSQSRLKVISGNLYKGGYYLVLEYRQSRISKKRLDSVRRRELLQGVTQVGPHRDDFNFVLVNRRNMSLKEYGSRGEQRTGVLCVKILELMYIEEMANEKPLLLLDDIFSELDFEYRNAIESIINGQQTIITTADINTVPDGIKKDAKIVAL